MGHEEISDVRLHEGGTSNSQERRRGINRDGNSSVHDCAVDQCKRRSRRRGRGTAASLESSRDARERNRLASVNAEVATCRHPHSLSNGVPRLRDATTMPGSTNRVTRVTRISEQYSRAPMKRV